MTTLNLNLQLLLRLSLACTLTATVVGCTAEPPLVERPKQPAREILISGGDVLDIESGTLLPLHDVLIREGRIIEVAEATTIVAAANATIVDATGGTVSAGLIDSHGHVGASPTPSWQFELPDPERNLQSFLYCGVTTSIDPAGSMAEAFAQRDKLAAGELLGPRVFAAGPMVTTRGGHPIPAITAVAPWWIGWYVRRDRSIEIDSAETAREAVKTLNRAGADLIKVAVDAIPGTAPTIGDELLEALINEAHSQGLRVVAHVGTIDDAIAAAEAGIDAWMHMPYKEAISPARAAELAAYDIPMVVTTTVFRSYATLGVGPRIPTTLERQTVAAQTLAAFNSPPEDAVPDIFIDYFGQLRQVAEKWDESILNLHNAGVQLLAGSDVQAGVFPGPGLHRELQALAAAGIPNDEVIRAGTLYGARLATGTQDPPFGTVEAGKAADLIVVEGNPLEDITSFERIRWVLREGELLQRSPVVSLQP
jgi:imidazolonepropionase-like amidohydrolase